MLKSFIQVLILLSFTYLKYAKCIKLNEKSYYYTGLKDVQFITPSKGIYEIVCAGADGGGEKGAPGGKGGISAGIMELESGRTIVVNIGGQGENSEPTCGGAGGGGATIAILNPIGNDVDFKILLIGPGGGGSGLNQRSNPPDINDKIFKEAVGDCDKCIPINKTCPEAADGRNLFKDNNFTYNPSISGNYTPGCLGGYGGGGQGSAVIDTSNKTLGIGGGGGGGGHMGGMAGKKENAKPCTAGGPGQAHCGMTYCNVTRNNPESKGYFLIKYHEPYKEIPNKDRTNYENPYTNLKAGGSYGIKTKFEFWTLMCLLISNQILC